MPKTPAVVAADIEELMRQNGNEAITLKWSQLYQISDREKLAETIMDKIATQLKKRDIHIIYGGNNVIVVRDFCWKPVTLN
ncbi:hypothetical protein [Aeromonas salmonicida]|jgi:hypothetical protein|uniref:hypothetical protein n=1 Tax=Aeromonas salmonicida TaxID=645 RepID=UPI0035A2F41A